MGLYDINFRRLSTLLLPMRLRGGALNAMLVSISKPLGELHQELVKYRADKDYRMSHNGQVCYLRALLNDKLDQKSRGIIIDEADSKVSATTLLHRRETSLTLRVGRREADSRHVRVYRQGLSGAGGIGFWVKLPERLQGVADESQLHALVSQYKLASVRYGVTYYV